MTGGSMSHQWLLLCLGAGVGWSYMHAEMRTALDMRLPACVDVDYRSVVIRIITRPRVTEIPGTGRTVARFRARLLESMSNAQCPLADDATLQLSWYDPPPLQISDHWRIEARLRAPWSYQNPGGFDYERWLFGQGLHGTGYVRTAELIRKGGAAVDGYPDFLKQSGARHSALILALSKGDGDGITGDQWDVFRRTGTVHLMVVSGLHVGLVLAASYFAFRLALRWLPMFVTTERPAGVLALIAAGVFVHSTGLGVPALRAWMMAAVVLMSLMLGRRSSALATLAVSATVVLLFDPLAIHQTGFYLSFAAVGVLLAGSRLGVIDKRPIVALMIMQLVLYLFMAPLLSVQQALVPGLGNLSNLLAVPLITLLLPLLLLTALSWNWLPQLAVWLLRLVDLGFDWLWVTVESASRFPMLHAGQVSGAELVIAIAAAALLISRVDRYWRPWLVGSWAVWLVIPVTGVPDGEFAVTALDVGQGSAIIVETRDHRLLFDTGPGYPGGFNLGAAAVVPSLLRTGPAHLDALVLSHPDLDHTGGYESVAEVMPISTIVVSDARALGNDASLAAVNPALQFCDEALSWEWNSVTFAFLNERDNKPPGGNGHFQLDNDRSCVLKVSNDQRTALFSGDIGRRVEARLLRRFELSADLVMAPHHGSNSSSSATWIVATQPRWALISAPRHSRYGHPHPAVLDRYRQAGVEVAVTGFSGALGWRSWRPGALRQQRRDRAAYWRNPPAKVLSRFDPDAGSSSGAG
jgi:competence protein ComEC